MTIHQVVIFALGIVKALGLWAHVNRLRVVESPLHFVLQVLDDEDDKPCLSMHLDVSHALQLRDALDGWLNVCQFGKKGGVP
jgi:type IV secretory pathway VirB3-like protein